MRPKGMFHQLEISSPKQSVSTRHSRQMLFPYYAGFSFAFAKDILAASNLPAGSTVLDPWNGAGTTALAAISHDYRFIGFDLNPLMTLVAQCISTSQVSENDFSALMALQQELLEPLSIVPDDPLLTWFYPSSVSTIRSIHRVILREYSSQRKKDFSPAELLADTYPRQGKIATLALCRAVRRLATSMSASNPTWTKQPKNAQSRLRPKPNTLLTAFIQELEQVLKTATLPLESKLEHSPTISTANSESLPIPNNAVDLVLSSPPYCTRIDYAVKTSIELAVLGIAREGQDSLRRQLIGTTAITSGQIIPDESWGATCLSTLESIKNHSSKASATYYLRTYLQYFASLRRSLNEIHRVLRPGGGCAIVIQDSHYKEIKVDLAAIVCEMTSLLGFDLANRRDFVARMNMANVHQTGRTYRTQTTAVESVVCLIRR